VRGAALQHLAGASIAQALVSGDLVVTRQHYNQGGLQRLDRGDVHGARDNAVDLPHSTASGWPALRCGERTLPFGDRLTAIRVPTPGKAQSSAAP
jgi:hypothetical protein